MDGQEFDKLSRKLTSFTSRRQALGGLLGAAAAVTGFAAAADAKKGKGKAKKGKGKGKGAGKEQCLSCFTGGGTCRNGLTEQYCGANGGACSECIQDFSGNGPFPTNGQVCSPNTGFNGGACTAAVPCGTFFNENCQLENFCVNATNDARVCGRRPVSVELSDGDDVTAWVCNRPCPDSQVCEANGNSSAASCVTRTCNADSCPNGCCTGNTCRVGTEADRCGTGGVACQNCIELCGLGNFGCQNGQCNCTTTTTTTTTTVPPTTPEQPCLGCLKNGVCRPGNRKGACGTGGAVCSRCGKKRTCSNGRCAKK